MSTLKPHRKFVVALLALLAAIFACTALLHAQSAKATTDEGGTAAAADPAFVARANDTLVRARKLIDNFFEETSNVVCTEDVAQTLVAKNNKPVHGELLLLGDFRHFAIMAVVRLAGPAAFIPSWLNPFSANIRDTQQPQVSRQATSSLGPGGIKQPPVCYTCLGSEIAIDKTESLRPAVGRYPVVAPPVRHACDAG